MSNRLVSIIIPVYNLELFIKPCIESILNQIHKNLQIIIVDDGSSDATLSIIKKYSKHDNRIEVVSQDNGGAAKARNAALLRVKGEFICYVDGDDVLSEDAISENLSYLEDDDKLDWVSFELIKVDKNLKTLANSDFYKNRIKNSIEIVESESFIPYLFKFRKLSSICCGFIYRWNSVKHLRFVDGLRYEDSMYFYNLICTTHKGLLSHKGKYLYVIRENSSQTSDYSYQKAKSDLYILKEKIRLFRQHFPQYEKYYEDTIIDMYYFWKNESSKGHKYCDEMIVNIKKEFPIKYKYNIAKEIKYMVYKYIGYRNIKLAFEYFKKIIKH